MTEKEMPWTNYTPPGGLVRLEGTTDEALLVTHQAVDVVPHIERTQPQVEKLFPVEASKVHEPRTSAPKKGIRARFRDNTDYSDKSLRSGLENDPPASHPDADLDETFGPAA